MEKRQRVRTFEDLLVWQMGIELVKRVYFLNIAKGSAGEVRSLLYVASEVGYLQAESYEELREQVTKISAYLFNHRRAIKNSLPHKT